MSSHADPAHLTKHIPLLKYPFAANTFSLAQLTDGVSNGTALWLGGQCLAMYLAQMHTKYRTLHSTRRPRAIELGSGIGLTALALCSLGWDVLATDIPHVISSVLEKNIKHNLPTLPVNSGTIQIRELDWSVLPEDWTWNHESVVASHLHSHSDRPVSADDPDALLRPPFDLIISADTVYSVELVEPMLRTLHVLSTLSASPTGSHFPAILLCIERRDPALVDRLLATAKEKWQFQVERIPHKKVVKAVEKEAKWNKSDWDDVELWKFKLLHST